MTTPPLETFDVRAPIETAATPPASWYLDPRILALERERVFARAWIHVARADQVADPGSFTTARIGDDPVVVTRDAKGALRALGNACRHHGTRVADGCGHASELTCPYHGWAYGLDGSLLRAPGAGAIRLERDAAGLHRLDVAAHGPLVFVRVDGGGGPSLDATLAPFADRLGPLDAFSFHARRTYRIGCNWKVFVDNYLDGGYHVPHLHSGLAGQLSLASYRTELVENGALQTCGGASPRIGGEAVYAFVHPNLMVNRYGRCLDVNVVLPTGPEECEVVFDWYFHGDSGGGGPAGGPSPEESVAISDRVQREDIAVSERVQEGMRSRFFRRGRYAPSCERGMHHFHARLARELDLASS